MTDDERAARKWLSKVFILGSAIEECRKHRATIQRLLDRPVMPRGSEVPDDVLPAILQAFHDKRTYAQGMRAAIDALHAHLTAPPPKKKVEAWAIKSANGELDGTFVQKSDAERYLERASGSRIVRLVEATDADK